MTISRNPLYTKFGFQIFCDVKAVVTETLTYVSILTIVAFTIERSVSYYEYMMNMIYDEIN